MFIPNRYHELELKRLARYSNNTQDRGLVLDPKSNIFNVDAYPDADFSGMYGIKRHDDPSCSKSRTGLTITFSDCPVFWSSKL